jgi:iron complex transport system substrate-binding protein
VRLRDLLGREVALPRPARRIVLGQGRHLFALNLLHPDPASLVVAAREDLRRDVATEYEAFRRRFPAVDGIPVVGGVSEPLPVEAIIASNPDLLLLSRWVAEHAGGAGGAAFQTLERAGVPVAVVDFFLDPFRDTDASLDILGKLLGREEQAAALAAFRHERLAVVASLLASLAERPTVMMHVHAGVVPCCASPGRGTFNDLIRFAGGRNLGAELMSSAYGQISPEHLLTRDPEIYVATGGAFGRSAGIQLGAGVGEPETRAGLARVLTEVPLAHLSATRNRRAHVLWHGFNDTPAHLLAVEALARWIHPERCRDLDPRATLAELNRRFAAVPMEGTYWADLGTG